MQMLRLLNGEKYSHISINKSIGRRSDPLTTAMLDFVSNALAKPVMAKPVLEISE